MKTMSHRGISMLLVFCLGGLGGCASTTHPIPMDQAALEGTRAEFAEIALNEWQLQARRLYAVSNRLFTKAVKNCSTTQASLGLLIEEHDQIPKRIRKELDAAGKSPPAVSVFLADPDRPAEAAQAVAAIDGIKIASAKSAKRIRELSLKESATIEIDNNDGRHPSTFERKAQARCSVPVEMAEDTALFAYYTGFRIVVSAGMVQALNDDQLALVVAHELGHRERDHVPKLVARQAAGLLVDVAAGLPGVATIVSTAAMRSPFEVEADRFAIDAIADAGFDVKAASTIFKVIAQKSPYAVGLDFWHTHPRLADRHVQLETWLADKASAQAPVDTP